MSKWLVAVWLDEDGNVINAETRGAFEDDESREEAAEELELDDAVAISLELEGDDEATLEVSDT